MVSSKVYMANVRLASMQPYKHTDFEVVDYYTTHPPFNKSSSISIAAIGTIAIALQYTEVSFLILYPVIQPLDTTHCYDRLSLSHVCSVGIPTT